MWSAHAQNNISLAIPGGALHCSILTGEVSIQSPMVGTAKRDRRLFIMYQLAYISTFGLSVGASDIAAILEKARTHNRRDELTGILIADGTRFLQVLEGDRTKVDATFSRISADRRHFAIYQLIGRDVENRSFGEWDMAYREVHNPSDADDLARQAEIMATNLSDPIIRDRLRYFLRLDRQTL